MKLPWMNEVIIYVFDSENKCYRFKNVQNYVFVREVEEYFDLDCYLSNQIKIQQLEEKLQNYPFAILMDDKTKFAISVKNVYNFSSLDEFPLMESTFTSENGNYYVNSSTFIDFYEKHENSMYKYCNSCNVFCHNRYIPYKFDLNCIKQYQNNKTENIQIQLNAARTILIDKKHCRSYKSRTYKHVRSFEI